MINWRPTSRFSSGRGLIESWHDRRISPGTEWKGQIDAALERAHLILLLVSCDFIASDYCHDVEMKRAIERHEERTARVIPIIIREVNFHSAEFGTLQVLPADGRAVTRNGRSARDRAWRKVADGIEKALEEMGGAPGPQRLGT